MTRRRSVPSTDAFQQTYLNQGEDDEMEIVFYRTSKVRLAFVWTAVVLTLIAPLLLVFYWRRDWYARSIANRCSADSEADWVLLKDKSMQDFAHKIRTHIISDGLKNNITGQLDNTSNGETKIKADSHSATAAEFSIQTYFFHQKLKYTLNLKKSRFEKMSVPPQQCSFLLATKGLTYAEQESRRWIFGPNSIRVHVTPICILLFTQALNPFYVFQLFSILLWTAGESYYYYAGCIGLLTIVSLAAQIIQQRMMERALKKTIGVNKSCIVWRADLNEWKEVSAETLVPGDVIQIPEAVDCLIPCDVILTSGDCIMNESMLTGESVPVTKVALEASVNDVTFDMKQHSRHVLFSGTNVIQLRRSEDGPVKGVVYRTGFSTSKGELVRSILFPKPIDFKFTKDSYKYVGFLAILALVGMVYTIVVKVLNGDDPGDVVIRTLDLVTIVVPPALPAAMTCGIVFAQFRLRKSRIFCISPNTINVCGSLDAFCFDKTGTLTEDGLDLLSIHQATDAVFDDSLDVNNNSSNGGQQVNDDVLEAMATCHSLAIINGTLNGDPLDLKMFQFTNWDFEEKDVKGQGQNDLQAPIIVRPKASHKSSSREIGILKQFTFSSKLQRMSVVTRRRTLSSPGDASREDLTLFTKGSPEMIASMCSPQTIPGNFDEILINYTSQGFRVIALASKALYEEVTTDSLAGVRNLTRDEAESDLTFLGLLVMENRLKVETTPVIHQLKAANIRPIMVTGDNMLTALSVARTCGMVAKDARVIIVSVSVSSSDHRSEIIWCPADLPKMDNLFTITADLESGNLEKALSSENDFSFAMTGNSWALLRQHYPQFIQRIVYRGIVFARFSPDQKKQLVEELQKLGYFVGMCGDGANDCGALKTAHAGISLSDAEASVASPFTSKDPNISCVLSLIREGRASLVTSFGIFKYMAGYSMTQFLIVCIITWPVVGSTMSDFEFLYEDLFLVTTLVFTFCFTGPYSSIAPRPPMISLIAMAPIVSLFCCMSLNLGVMIFSYYYTQMQPWYESPDTRDGRDLEDTNMNYDQTVLFLFTCTQFITMAVIFSKGSPYRASIFSNYFFLINLFIGTSATIIMIFNQWDWWAWLLELKMPPSLAFEALILGVSGIHFFVLYIVEVYFVDGFVERWLQPCFSRCCFKETVQHRLVEKELRALPDWPQISDKSFAQVMEMELAATNSATVEEAKDKDMMPKPSSSLNPDSIRQSNGIVNAAFEFIDECDVSMTIDNAADDTTNQEESLLRPDDDQEEEQAEQDGYGQIDDDDDDAQARL